MNLSAEYVELSDAEVSLEALWVLIGALQLKDVQDKFFLSVIGEVQMRLDEVSRAVISARKAIEKVVDREAAA